MIADMKRVIALMAFLLLAFSVPAPAVMPARAESGERYAVATAKDVWFYADADESTGLFCLPYTYYVKVISEGEIYTAVEYLRDSPPYRKIAGYCKSAALTFVDFIPARPYLFREITVEYVLPGTSLGNGSFSSVERTFVYYGTRYDAGSLYFYVCRDGVFDYIPAQEELVYELNTDYLPSPSEDTGNKTGLSAVHIAVICVACCAAVAIAVFVMRGKKPSVPQENSDF